MDILTIFILNLIVLSNAFTIYEETVIPCMFDSDCKGIASTAKCMNKICKCDGNCGYRDTVVVNKIGHPCNSLQDCNVEGSYCVNSTCTCKVGTVVSSNKKKCLKVSQGLGSECIEDNQCSANVTSSICANKMCSCGPNMHLLENKCIENKNLGQSCHISEECIVDYSICEGTCKCIRRYVKNGNSCLLVSKTLYSPCMHDIQCQETLGVGSHCVNNVCQCHDLYHLKPTANKCVKDLLLGDFCNVNEDCHQPGSGERRLECILGECKCKPQYFQINDFCASSSQKLSLKWIPMVFVFRSIFLIVKL